MKKTEIKISFDMDKLAALKQYMEKKDSDIIAELEEAVGKLYEKFVPAAVKEFIDYNGQAGDLPEQKSKKTDKPGLSVKKTKNVQAQDDSIKTNEAEANTINNADNGAVLKNTADISADYKSTLENITKNVEITNNNIGIHQAVKTPPETRVTPSERLFGRSGW